MPWWSDVAIGGGGAVRQPAPEQPAAPSLPQSGGSDNRDNQDNAWAQAREQQMAGTPWGGFGTYGNWANAFAGQHGGRAPGVGDEADYWDSQIFAQNEGRPPSWGEWRNRWETGKWDEGMPWQLRYPGPGRKYYGEPFTNMRGSALSPDMMRAMANPDRMPWGLRSGFIPWMQNRYQSAPTLPGMQPYNTGAQSAARPAVWQPSRNWNMPLANAVNAAPAWVKAMYYPQMGYTE